MSFILQVFFSRINQIYSAILTLHGRLLVKAKSHATTVVGYKTLIHKYDLSNLLVDWPTRSRVNLQLLIALFDITKHHTTPERSNAYRASLFLRHILCECKLSSNLHCKFQNVISWIWRSVHGSWYSSTPFQTIVINSFVHIFIYWCVLCVYSTL